jgi:hypothetical protein
VARAATLDHPQPLEPPRWPRRNPIAHFLSLASLVCQACPSLPSLSSAGLASHPVATPPPSTPPSPAQAGWIHLAAARLRRGTPVSSPLCSRLLSSGASPRSTAPPIGPRVSVFDLAELRSVLAPPLSGGGFPAPSPLPLDPGPGVRPLDGMLAIRVFRVRVTGWSGGGSSALS